MGPAYERIIDHVDDEAAETLAVLDRDYALDPYAADLAYHRARRLLKLGRKAEYAGAVKALKRLTPHSELVEVLTRRGPE